jgi:hypothetical protein
MSHHEHSSNTLCIAAAMQQGLVRCHSDSKVSTRGCAHLMNCRPCCRCKRYWWSMYVTKQGQLRWQLCHSVQQIIQSATADHCDS